MIKLPTMGCILIFSHYISMQEVINTGEYMAHSLSLSRGEDFYSYSSLVRQYPILTEAEELELALQIKNGQCKRSAEKLIVSHLRLVTSMAYKMRGYGLVLMDLVGEGTIGLMHAVKKFNPDIGKRFSVYASLWIKAFMQEYIIRSWSLVKIGTTVAQKKLFFHLKKVKAKILALQNDKSLSDQDYKLIAKDLSVKQSEVHEMDSRLSRGISLDEPISNESDNSSNLILVDTLADTTQCTETKVIDKDVVTKQKKILLTAINTLDARQADIITKRHLSDKVTPLHIIGKQYNISSERVRQLETMALKKITEHCYLNYRQ